MKKIFSILLVVVMIIGTSVTTMAEGINNNITANVSFSAENNALCVKGEIKSARDGIPMTLIVKQAGSIVALAETVALGKNEGKVSYSFDSVKLNKMLPDGELLISVSADMVDLECETTYQYVGINSQYTALSKVNEAVASDAPLDVISAVNTYSQALGVDAQKLSGFSSDVSLIAAGTMMKSYELPSACNSDEDIEKIKAALGEFNKVYTDGIVVGEFFAKSDIAGISQWYNTYKDTYGLSADIPGTAENEKNMLVYVTSALTDESFALRRENMKTVKDIEELAISIYHQAILHNAEKGNSYIVRNVIDDFPSLLTINTGKWNILSEDQKGTVVTTVSGKVYNNFSELSTAINAAMGVLPLGNSGDRYSDSSGHSGGSSGGKSGNVNVQVPTTMHNASMGFTDIAHVGWAEPSIKYLYSKGIINGKSADVFAPDDVVTRAELVKMLTVALGLKNTGTGKVSFTDVKSDAWYADYVYIAVEKGLIQGDGNGKFNPGASVSRQDAATIIYRAINNSSKVEKSYFDDYESIAPYARDAVNYLCAMGIVNGIGDGTFAPKAELSRAQAAKILHLFLTQ